MKKLSCADMGSDCQYTATGNTGEEVKQKVWAHAAKDHREMLATMTDQQQAELTKKIDQMLAAQV